MINFNPDIAFGDIVSGLIATVGVLAAVLTFVVQQRGAARLQRVEIYQRLELASSELFTFEAEHADTLERFRDKVVRPEKFGEAWPALEKFWELEDGEAADRVDPTGALRQHYQSIEDDVRIARKYYEKTLNLFEMAARFRHDEIMDERVFGSWVIWYFDTVREWSFRWMWPQLRKNYTNELRDVFNFPVLYFDWVNEEEKALERDFFIHTARLVRCSIVNDWLDAVEKGDTRLRSRIASAGVPEYPSWPAKYGKPLLPKNRKGAALANPLATHR